MMSIIGRLLQGRIDRAVEAVVSKSAGFMPLETAAYPDHKPDSTRIADYPTFIQAFRSMPWVYAAATATAIAATKPDLKTLREVKKDGETDQEEVSGEDINKLVELPNPDLSWRELIQITVINLDILGNAYWCLVGTKENQPISRTNPPVEIWWVKPEQMQPIPDEFGVIIGYEFTGPTGQKKMVDPSEIIHFRLPNPGSYFLGMGMMEPLTATTTLEAKAVAFMNNFMDNDGTPPFVFNHPGSPEATQRKAFFAAWDERHKGAKRAGRPGMIWGGMKIDPLSSGTIKDTQYPELRKMNREETLAGCGVPPSVVGLLEYANYSNMEVQQKKFWEDAVIPILGIVADKMTLKLAPYFDERYWFEFDFSKIKVLQEDEERKSRVAATLIQNGLKTPNQILREMFNAEPYVGGDQHYITMSLVPIGENLSPADAAAKRLKRFERKEGKPEDAPKVSFWAAPERKKALWQAFEKRINAQERAFIPELEKFFGRQAREVREKIEKADSVSGLTVGHVFDKDAEAKAYTDKFEARYRNAFEHGGNAGNEAAKGMIWLMPEERHIKAEDEFRISAEHLQKLKAQMELAASHIHSTIWDEIRDVIQQANAEAMTVGELAQAIGDKLDGYKYTRARLVARTEMARTENFGTLEGYKENEFVDKKGWLCQFVPDSREAHMQADGEEVAIDADFEVGGEHLEYPGDMRGDPGNTCNCLCTTYPVIGANE